MTISIRQFTDLANQATQRKGYLDIQKTQHTDALGRTVTQDELVIRGTDLWSRMKRALGMRPQGAADRVHQAYIASLKQELGLQNWNALPQADQAALSAGREIPSARRRILASAGMAQQLLTAKEQTQQLLNQYVVQEFPGLLLGRVIHEAHAELQAQQPGLYPDDHPGLKAQDLAGFPRRGRADAGPEDLELLVKIRANVNAVLLKDPKNPVPQAAIERAIRETVKTGMVKAQPFHEALQEVGLPRVDHDPQQGPHPLAVARTLIASRDQLYPVIEVQTFKRALQAAPRCAQHLLQMASADPNVAREATLNFFHEIAQARARQMDARQGQDNEFVGTHPQVMIRLGIELARSQGLDVARLRETVRNSDVIYSLAKEQMNFVKLGEEQGDFLSLVASGVGLVARQLADELERGPEGTIAQGQGSDRLLMMHDQVDAATGLNRGELDAAADGPVFERVMGFNFAQSPEQRADLNESRVRALLADQAFIQTIEAHSGAQITTLQPGLGKFLQDEIREQTSVRDRDGTSRTVRTLSPDEALKAASQAARDFVDYKQAVLHSAGGPALSEPIRREILGSPRLGEPADTMALEALKRNNQLSWSEARAQAQAGASIQQALLTLATRPDTKGLADGLVDARGLIFSVAFNRKGQADPLAYVQHLQAAMELACEGVSPQDLRAAYREVTNSPLAGLLAGIEAAQDPQDDDERRERVKLPAYSMLETVGLLARVMGAQLGESEFLALMRMANAKPSLEVPPDLGLEGMARMLGTPPEKMDELAQDLSQYELPADEINNELRGLGANFRNLMGDVDDVPAFVPPGLDSVVHFGRPELKVALSDGTQRDLPMVAYQALSGHGRQEVGRALQAELRDRAALGPVRTLIEPQSVDLLKDLARGMLNVHVDAKRTDPAVGFKRNATEETDAHAAGPRLLKELGQTLERLGLHGPRYDNALRDFTVLLHQGIFANISIALNNDSGGQALGLVGAQSGRIILSPDPEVVGSFLISLDARQDPTSISVNGVDAKIEESVDANGRLVEAKLPAEVRNGFRLRYTPSETSGEAGSIECLNAQRGYVFRSLPGPLISDSQAPPVLDARGAVL